MACHRYRLFLYLDLFPHTTADKMYTVHCVNCHWDPGKNPVLEKITSFIDQII